MLQRRCPSDCPKQARIPAGVFDRTCGNHHSLPKTNASSAQVDSPDSLENVESKWVSEIVENCPGVELVLVALKCDLRPSASTLNHQADDDDDDVDGEGQKQEQEGKREMLTYQQGLDVAKRIQALRYLGECFFSCCLCVP